MSSIDKLRSFAEAREAGEVTIRDGFTYADARALLKEIDRLRAIVGSLVGNELGKW